MSWWHNVVFSLVLSAAVAATLTKVSDFQKIAEMVIFSTPGVVVNGEVKSVGSVPKQTGVEKWIS